MTTLQYNTTLTNVQYSTDEEYFAFYFQLFSIPISMDISQICNDESAEQQQFDQRTNIVLNEIYETTEKHLLFRKIYLASASQFMCEDLKIGLRILFSYSFLHLFHPLLCDFLEGVEITDENPHYVALLHEL